MHARHLFAATAAFLLSLAPSLAANATLGLETEIYVFKNSDFHAVNLTAGTVAVGESRELVFQSPGAVAFDRVTLSLDGSRRTWSGDAPSGQFSLIAAPKVPVTAGRPVTITCSVPFQYMERLPDGNLHVRDVPSDSPEAPHYQLTLTVRPAGAAANEYVTTCSVDIATVRSRENIPGVALDVGKPVVAHFTRELKFSARENEWTGLLLRAPNGSDYSTVMLLKLSSGPAVASPEAKTLAKIAEFHLKTARFGATAVAGGNYIYTVDGENLREGILGDIERFDVRTHEISVLTDKLIPRHHGGAALIGDKIYVFGGTGYGLPGVVSFEGTVEVYDIPTGRITRGAPMPTARTSFATAVWDGKIYAIGGVYGEQAQTRETNRTEIYDPVTDSWSPGLPMPTIREAKAVVTADGIIAVGGHHSPSVSIGSKIMEGFAPGQNRWFTLPELSQPVSAYSAAVLENTIFIFGNYDSADEILAYDLATHRSTLLKGQLTATSQSIAVAHDGRIYVIGGTGGGGSNRVNRDAFDNIQVFALQKKQ